LLRGPDSAGLESDLSKVERRLSRLDLDDTLSPTERELEKLYFIHWRKRLHRLLKQEGVSLNQVGPEVAEAAGAPLNKIKPSDESWKAITPPSLIRAVTHIRGDFEHLCDAQRDSLKDKCFRDLHALASGMTEPSVFKRYFYECIERIQQIVVHGFGRFLEISLSQDGLIGAAPIQWASLQVFDLVEREDRLVDGWIKSVCDKHSYLQTTSTQAFVDKNIFRTDWRAPQWVQMQPNGNVIYDATVAWERMNESDTKDVLRYLREDRWILLLQSTAKELAGVAYETLAKRRATPRGEPKEEKLKAKMKATERIGRSRTAKPLMLKYRSGIKRAILGALTKNPTATDAEVCRSLDADGGEDLPPGWKTRKEDRSFFAAYATLRTKRKIEIAISKVRSDLRDRGLLQ
jgi:hypothetical protein